MHNKLSPHFYPEDYLHPKLLKWWSLEADRVIRVLLMKENYFGLGKGSPSGKILIQPDVSFIKEKILNGRKPKSSVGGNSGKSDKSVGFQWVNVPLTDEDNNWLIGSTITLEQCAASLIGLVTDGYDVSVKYQAVRKQYVASIYRPSSDDSSNGVGVSGFSTDVRDAILVVMYKFDNKLGGELPVGSNAGASNQQRRFG